MWTKNTKILFYFLLSVVVRNTSGYSRGPQVKWSNQIDLEVQSGIKFRWRNTEPDEDGQRWLIMEVSARATGYVGVGFSPNGGMIDGDMAIAWMDSNGNPNLKDFYGVENGHPIEDSSQDYHLLHFEEDGGWTTFKFQRRWDTCDPNDFAITNDTLRLIWAHSNAKPEVRNGNFRARYHGATDRGVKSVIISEGAMSPIFPDQAPEKFPGVKHFDMTATNVPITLKDTYYHCQVMKFTDLSKKHHMIGWRPLIQQDNLEIVHHMVLYECTVPEEETAMFDEHQRSHPGGTCFTPNMPAAWGRNCVSFFLVWVVGSEGDMLPQHVGSALGEMHGGATYFMIEMHYENPAHRITTDSSGIRLFYTDQLREYDGSTMLVGYRHSPFLFIPPVQNNFMINGLCGSECTTSSIPPTGINVTSANLHLHLAGKRIRLRHFRNGIELPVIFENNYYDFNYQVPRFLKEEITILPGDDLVTECEYTTKDVDRYVIGGLATNQEMCQIFFFYYPRVPLTQCTSQSEFHDFFKGLNIDKVEGKRVLKALNMPFEPHLLPPEDREKDMGDDARELEAIEAGLSYKSVFNHMNITQPTRLQGKSVGQYLEEEKWSNRKGQLLERFWKHGKHYQFCSRPGLKRVLLKNHIIEYPQVKQALERGPSPVCLRKNQHNVFLSAGSNNVVATVLLVFSFAIIIPKFIY